MYIIPQKTIYGLKILTIFCIYQHLKLESSFVFIVLYICFNKGKCFKLNFYTKTNNIKGLDKTIKTYIKLFMYNKYYMFLFRIYLKCVGRKLVRGNIFASAILSYHL